MSDKPTKEQLNRRYVPFKFTYKGKESWFYLLPKCSFHQRLDNGQKDVFGVRVTTLIKALKACGYIAIVILLSCGVADAKEVVIEYQDFLKMLAIKEHSDKTANRYAAENAVLVKLKDEQGAVISLQQEDIRACREIVKTHEQLGETEAQISKVVESELRKQIETEKRLSRYKSEMVYATGIIAAVVWGMKGR